MARVVPSQVVGIIDQLFPAAKNQKDIQGQRFSVSRSNQNELAAIIDLVERIPPELITLDPKTYTGLILSINAIKTTIPNWLHRDYGVDRIHGYGNLNPITIIRNALSQCPDKGTSPTTSDLAFISDPELRKSLRLDISSANQAFANGEWKAATVLAGATIEALLLYILQSLKSIDPSRITNSVNKLVSNKTLSKSPGGKLDSWSFHPLIEVAVDINLITKETAAQARLARNFRNLIHPGASIRKNQICNRGTALSALAALEHVVNDLS